MQLISNVVNSEGLSDLYIQVLEELAGCLERSFGPNGSNTLIQKGANVFPEYSKDGHTILSNIKYHNIIESTIASNVLSITQYIAKTVGDGTTTAVIMSSILLNKLIEYMKAHKETPPAAIMRSFSAAVKAINVEIATHGRNFELSDALDIARISTNGDETIAGDIMQLYKELGKDLYINLSIVNNIKDVVNIYDGMVIESGLIEECYINDAVKKVAHLESPRIYAFMDAIDTPEMATFMDTILKHNIVDPWVARKADELIPTVIITPTLSRDCSAMMTGICDMMSQLSGANVTHRPPLLIVTNLDGPDQDMYGDIVQMCGCKFIKKYIDPKLQKIDIEKGIAPTVETVCEFYGTAKHVEADQYKTTFVQPAKMVETKEDGTIGHTQDYNNLVSFLETEIEKAYDNQATYTEVHGLKRRLHSLKAALVDWLVGGLSAADRDARKASIEDAIKNCRSAAKDGVGYGANFEGLRASMNVLKITENGTLSADFIGMIYEAYRAITIRLYGSVYNADRAAQMVDESLENGRPFNLRDKELPVLSSIKSDQIVLECIDKIITIMATSNQYICPEPIDTAPYRAEESARKKLAESEKNNVEK